MNGIALRRHPAFWWLAAAAVGALTAVLAVRVDVRLLLAVFAIGAAAVAAVRFRQAAALATLAFLPFLGLVRRLLIPVDGWPKYDPLLLIGPAVVLTLFFLAWYEGRLDWRSTPLSYWVTLLTAWMAIEMFNPSGLSGNIAGGMYIVIPLLWFFVGRTYGDLALLRTVLVYVLCAMVLIACYGLYQTFVGFPPWDLDWIRVGGYAALHVAGVVRAFGTFPSSAEYGFSLGVGVVIAFALLVRGGVAGRRWAPLLLAAIALMGVALFFESQRSALLYALGACGLVWAVAPGTRRRVITRLALTAVAAGGAYLAFAHSLAHVAVAGAVNGLVTHDTHFLVDPFGAHSTLPGHLQRIVGGIRAGLRRPWGYGLGAVSVAGKLGGAYAASGTEFDLSNAFVAGGVVGGLLFLPAWIWGWARAAVGARQAGWVLAAVLGVLVAVFGNWMNGGQYFLSAFVWFVLGVVDRVLGTGDPHPAHGAAAVER